MNSKEVLERLQYHTQVNNSAYAFNHLKQLSTCLDESNYLTYAFILQNPNLTEEERSDYQKCFELCLEKEKALEKEIQEMKERKLNEAQNRIEEISAEIIDD
jgi:tRNA A22 N-methylase